MNIPNKLLILQLIKLVPLFAGFLSWDVSDCHVDLEEELNTITQHAPEGEEARHGKSSPVQTVYALYLGQGARVSQHRPIHHPAMIEPRGGATKAPCGKSQKLS